MNKTMRHVRLSTPLSVKELRLVQGLTIQAASELSGISQNRLKRWERNGVGKINVYEVSKLLDAYHSNIECCDCNRKPTKRQIFDATLNGSFTVMPNGESELDAAKLIKLLRLEGFDDMAQELYWIVAPTRERLKEKRNAPTVQSESA